MSPFSIAPSITSTSFFNVTGWGVKATATHYCNSDTVKLVTKTGDNKSLEQIVASVLPDKSNFYCSPTQFNGTLQSIGISNKKFDTPAKRVHYGRRIFTFKDKGSASVDYVIDTPKTDAEKKQFEDLAVQNLPEGWPRQNRGNRFLSKSEIVAKLQPLGEDNSNVLIICHGLGGGSHEPLIRDLVTTVQKKGPDFAEIMVLNCRGCSRTKITTPELFCGYSTGDLREVIDEINTLFPKRNIFLIGYSFGALNVLNYLAQEGSKAQKHNIRLAIPVSAPFDLIACTYRLKSTYSGRYIFEPALVSYLKRLIKNNRAEFRVPGIRTDDEFLKTITTMHEFDAAYTAKFYNFNSEFEYYRKVSPVNRLSFIKVPLVAINSHDDPCVGGDLPIIELSSNPYLMQIETDLGGHLAFLDYKGESWVNHKVCELMNVFSDKLDLAKPVIDGGYESKKNVFGE